MTKTFISYTISVNLFITIKNIISLNSLNIKDLLRAFSLLRREELKI